MKQTRQKVRNQVLGPRALAVISCALALLAAQPLMGTSAKGRETVASVKVADELQPAQPRVHRVSEKAAAPRKDRLVAADLPQSSRLHILATVEMLQRMLAFELRPMERQIVPALLFEPVLVAELLIAPSHRPCAIETPQLLKLAYEQQFAIEQCLLAPPAA